MLDEMKHRLRNAYSIGSSIAMISALDCPENSDFAASIANRLLSISEIQTAMIDIMMPLFPTSSRGLLKHSAAKM